jgi:hypothetical protein
MTGFDAEQLLGRDFCEGDFCCKRTKKISSHVPSLTSCLNAHYRFADRPILSRLDITIVKRPMFGGRRANSEENAGGCAEIELCIQVTVRRDLGGR